MPDSLVNGFNDIIGMRYQRYLVKRDCKEAEISQNKAKYSKVQEKGAPSNKKGNLLRKVFDGFKGLFRKGGRH